MGGSGASWRVFPDEARRDAAPPVRAGLDHVWLEWVQLLAGQPEGADVLCDAFAAAIAFPGSGPAERRLATDLAHAGMSEEQLRQGCEALPGPLRPRALVAMKRYTAWVRTRTEGAMTDEVQLLARARLRLDLHGIPPALGEAGSLWLFLDRPLSPLELSFLLSLAQACERAGLRLSLEVAASGEPTADAALESLFSALEQQAQSLNFVELARGQGAWGEGPWMELAAHALEQSGSEVPPSPSPTPLELVVARSPADEAEEIARRVQRLLAEGAAPESIAIGLFGDDPEEERRFASALARRRVPVTRSLATLGGSPAAGRVLEIFSLLDDDAPVERLARLLPPPPGDAPSPLVLLREAGVRDQRWGAVGGKGGYTVRLEALEQRLMRRKPERAASVRALRLQCEALLAALQGLPAQAPLGELLHKGWALAQRWAFREGEGPLRAQLERSLREVARRLGATRLWEHRVSRRQVREGLEEAWRRLPLPEERPEASRLGSGVELLDGRKLAGRRFTHLFLPGLESDRFPATGSAPSMLPEETRRLLNQWAERRVLPIRREVDRDRLSWVQALNAAHGTLTLSFSQGGWEGESRTPSTLVRGLAQAVGRAVPENPAPRFDLEGAVTEAELRVVLARRSVAGQSEGAAVARVVGQEAWLQEAKALAAVEQERLSFFSYPESEPGLYTGRLSRSELLAQALRFGPERPLSASALGRWGNCAYQGWLTSVLKLEPRELASEDVDSRGQGSLWHAVLEKLIPRLGPKGVPQAALDEVLNDVAGEWERRGMACHPTLWALAKQSARQMVQRLLQTGGLFPFDGLSPRKMELAFGTARSDEAWQRVTLPGEDGEEPVCFEGKIDRLDVGDGGVAVLDYKSSVPRSDSEAADALLQTQFQLPLYLYAARAAGHAGALRAAWISMKTGEVRTLEQLLDRTGQTVEGLLAVDGPSRRAAAAEARPNLANAVHGLLRPVREGLVPARPQDCRNCGLEAVCRVTQRRVEELS